MLTSSLWILVVLSRSYLAGGNAFGHDRIIPQSPVIERGSSITLSCILDKKHLSYTNSSGVFWRLNDDLIPQEYYTVVSETISNVTLHNFTAASRHLKCCIYHLNRPQLLHQTELKSGYLPEVPKNISCVYFYMKNFTCSWAPGRNTALQTEYVLKRKVHSVESICRATTNACSFLYPDLHFDLDYEVSVKAENALGEVTSDAIKVNTLDLVKTAPPEVVSVEPISGLKKMLKVVWKRPLLVPTYLSVKCTLKYRRTNSSNWVASIVVHMDKKELGTFNLSGLLDVTAYAVVVRCIGTEDQIHWSDWSAEKTGTTEEQAPLKVVDLWRVINSSQSNGNRTVHLMWKEFELQHSGKTLGYRIQCFLESNTSHKRMVNTTEKAIAFNITEEAYLISVVAYNSAGDSPEATLRIPPFGEEPQKLLADVQAFTHNEQLVVRWKPSVSAVDGYVVEWCVDSDICDISWQYIPNSTEWTSTKGSFQRFKCYNISVYPLFDNKVGAPYSTQAYIAEGPPQHGPSPEADNLGKHEVTLKWEKIPKAERNGFITNYTIVYMAYKEIQMNKTVSPDILEYTLKSLQPNTQYNVYIIASTNAGQSNGTSINFSTLKIDKEDIALIIGVVAGCTLLVVVIGMACLHKKHKLKTACWPDVPDPSASSMAEWFQETCKMNPLLKIHLDGILRVENINVLDSFSPTENQTNHIVEYPKNMLESTTRAQNYPYCIQQDFAKPPSPLSYVTAEKGYKSQTPSDAPGEGRSESMSCLIQGLSSEDDETQDTTIDEAFEGGASFNPYLKNSVMTREFIFPVNCVDLKGAGSKQQLMIIAPCQKAGLGKHYVTVDMLGLNVVH